LLRYCITLLLPLAGLATARAAEVTATRLDGTTVTGELANWSPTEITLTAADGNQQIATNQLLSIRWASPSTEKPVVTTGQVELLDGTQIPISSLKVAGKTATLTLDSAGDAKLKPVEVPTTQVSTVHFQRLDPALTGQWDEIRKLKPANDVLIVLKRDGKSLDYVEGVIGDITDDKVDFKLDGELNRVDRAKVAGIIYYRAGNHPVAESRVSIHGRSGFEASVAGFELVGRDTLQLTTIGGTKLAWPLSDLAAADFSAGKLVFLSDIDPASQNWTPLVSLPSGVTIAGEYGQPRRDRSAFGGKLTLLTPDPADPTAPHTSRTFDKGLALRSRTELVYRLPAGFKRFIATAGIDPAAGAVGNLRLAILADDRPLLETEVAGDQPPQPIDVDIAGAKRLKILVEFGQNLDSGDWLNLCDAKIVK
jgi:hypothetical protein